MWEFDVGDLKVNCGWWTFYSIEKAAWENVELNIAENISGFVSRVGGCYGGMAFKKLSKDFNKALRHVSQGLNKD